MNESNVNLERQNANLKQQLHDLLGHFNNLVASTDASSLALAFGEEWCAALREIRAAVEQPVEEAESVVAQRDILVQDLANYTWLKERSRWASISTKFDRTHTYQEHYVTWHVPEHGWVHASGQSFDEAVESARRTRINDNDEVYVDRSMKL